MTATFDPWNEDDLIRFLRTFAQLLDDQDEATAAEVRDAMGLDDDAARRAQKRLRGLELLEDSPIPRRGGDGELTSGRILTRSGILVAISGNLSDA